MIPLERPSSPSIQLMLLIIPTIQKIVNPIANAPSKRMHAAAERIRDEVDGDAERDGEDRERELAEELPAGAQVEQVVDRAEDRGKRRRQGTGP